MPDSLVKSLKHTLAVVVALGVASALVRLMGVDSPVVQGVIGLVVVALEKFVRADERVPVKDFVNE